MVLPTPPLPPIERMTRFSASGVAVFCAFARVVAVVTIFATFLPNYNSPYMSESSEKIALSRGSAMALAINSFRRFHFSSLKPSITPS
jgi:hypothetical protein